jgi:hypothetical protein
MLGWRPAVLRVPRRPSRPELVQTEELTCKPEK